MIKLDVRVNHRISGDAPTLIETFGVLTTSLIELN